MYGVYLQRALLELGLSGPPIERLRDLPYETAVLELEVLKKKVIRTGRTLLGRYHPDKHPGDVETLKLFKTINMVLQRLDTVKLARPQAPPSIHVSYTQYPARSPYGGTVSTTTTTTTNTGYFSYRDVSGGIKYDARRVVFVVPK